MAVYVIGPVGGPFKIGTSFDVQRRLSALQTGSPLDLEVVIEIPGNHGLETALHDKFKNKRIRGEWFKLNNEDLQEILLMTPQESERIELPTVVLWPLEDYPGNSQLGSWCVYCDRFHLHGGEDNLSWHYDSRVAHCDSGSSSPYFRSTYFLKPVEEKDLPIRARKELIKARKSWRS